MPMLTGLKSIIGLLIAAGAAPFLTKLTGLSPDEQLILASGGVGAVGIALRFVTSSPVAIGLRKRFANRFQKGLTPEQLEQVRLTLLAELLRLQKEARAKRAAATPTPSTPPQELIP